MTPTASHQAWEPLHHSNQFKQQAWTALTSITYSYQMAQFSETFQYNTSIIEVLKSLLKYALLTIEIESVGNFKNR